MKRITFDIFLFATIVCLSVPVLSDGAFAQEAPGRIEKRFEQPVQPRSRPAAGLRIHEAMPPAQAETIKLRLGGVNVKGSTIYSSEELQELYDEFIGKRITLLNIYGIVNKITQKYGEDGYTLSRAYLPPQQIDRRGIVTIKILEGYVDEVITEGEFDNARSLFAQYGYKITQDRPLNTKTMERYLLLANDLPGLTVKSVLRKSKRNPGASTLVLQVSEKKLDANASVDNRGTESQGPYQFSAGAGLSNPFGMFTETRFNYTQIVPFGDRKELAFYGGSHKWVLNSEGTALEFSGNYNTSEPGGAALRALEQKSGSYRMSVDLSHPFIRTRQQNLTGSLRYDHKHSKTDILGTTNSQDDLRVLRGKLNYDYSDQYQGTNQAIFELSQGLDIWGATKKSDANKSRAEGGGVFTKATLNLSRTQGLGYFSPKLSQFSLYASAMGQYAVDPLLSAEECGYGGQVFGRAFDSSAITGDKCLMGSLELRFSPSITSSQADYFQFFAFIDGGRVWNEDSVAGTIKQADLSSAGIGIRGGFYKWLTVSGELAWDLDNKISDGNNANAADKDGLRAFFRVGVKY